MQECWEELKLLSPVWFYETPIELGSGETILEIVSYQKPPEPPCPTWCHPGMTHCYTCGWDMNDCPKLEWPYKCDNCEQYPEKKPYPRAPEEQLGLPFPEVPLKKQIAAIHAMLKSTECRGNYPLMSRLLDEFHDLQIQANVPPQERIHVLSIRSSTPGLS